MTPSNDVAVLTLAEFLAEKLDGVKILTEWPDPKERLELPSISIITKGTPIYRHTYQTIVKRVPIPNTVNQKVVYKVGHYDANLQLDIWVDYKSRRSELYERLMEALDSQFVDLELATGLSLELIDYHNVFARYDQSGYTYMDNEENSKVEAWRVKVDLMVNYPRLMEKTESRMEEITLKTRVDEYVEVSTDVTDETTIIDQEVE